MVIHNSLGTLKGFIGQLKLPSKLLDENKLPPILEEIYVLSYNVEQTNPLRVTVTVLYTSHHVFKIPGSDLLGLTIALTDAGYTRVEIKLEEEGGVKNLIFSYVPFTLRFDEKLLRPAAPEDEYAQIAGRANFLIDEQAKIKVEDYNTFYLNRSYLGKTGLVISAVGVTLALSDTDNTSTNHFQGVQIAEAIVELPSSWIRLTPADELVFPVEIAANELEAEFNPDPPIPIEEQQEEVVPNLPTSRIYPAIVARDVAISTNHGFSGELTLDLANSDYLATELPLGLKVQLETFSISFVEDKVTSSNIQGVLEIPQLTAIEEEEALQLRVTGIFSNVAEDGELAQHPVYRFALEAAPEQYLQLGDFPVRLEQLGFEFQDGSIREFRGAGMLQLPGVQTKDKLPTWIPFELVYADDFFTIRTQVIENLRIGSDVVLNLDAFAIRFNPTLIDHFEIDGALGLVPEREGEERATLALKLLYNREEKHFTAAATNEQEFRIGNFQALISSLAFELKKGELESFGFFGQLLLPELKNREGATSPLHFQVQKDGSLLTFTATEQGKASEYYFKSLALTFTDFTFTLLEGYPAAPSTVKGELQFPPKVEDPTRLVFGMELHEDGYAVEVEANELKEVAIGTLELVFERFHFATIAGEVDFDIRGKIKSETFRDAAGQLIDHLSFLIDLTEDGFTLRVDAPAGSRLQLLEIEKVLDVQLESLRLSRMNEDWGFAFVGDFINTSKLPFVQKTIPEKFIFKELSFSTASMLPKLEMEVDWPDGQKILPGIIEDGKLEIIYPIRMALGGIFNAEQLQINTTLKGKDTFSVELSVLSPSLSLGPISGTVDSAGFQADLVLAEDGNLGVVDFEPRFSVPKGIGIAVVNTLINGGGYLKMDRQAGTLEGILALSLKGIDLTGIGLITTSTSKNGTGFSMLISMSVIFRPGIQLSFGFTLNGVGGLIGIHRTIAVDEIRKQLRSGKIEKLMFPKDITKNASAVINNLNGIFPVQKNHFVIGPFLKIGWGTPQIIDVELGVFLEIPFKGRVILLGSVGLYLPTPKAALVKIKVDVLGDFNLADRYIRVEGRLRDSRLVGIPLKGGFAFVLGWGREPQFLLSVGGYHPRYRRPRLFPEIGRLSAVIKKGSKLVLSCAYYQAVSSNSFQTGAEVRLKAKFAGARIEGHFSYDALLMFNPFYFAVDMHFGVNIKVKRKKLAGVELHFLLQGPKPWSVQGYAKIRILFFKLKIKLRLSWGGTQRKQQLSMAPQVLLDRLQKALEQPGSWKSVLPAQSVTAEILRKPRADEATILRLHPAGALEVRQKVIPLNHRIQNFGRTVVRGAPTYTITKVRIGEISSSYSSKDEICEYFARGQYEQLSNAKQLSTSDFEPMQAGLRLNDLAGVVLSNDMATITRSFEEEFLETGTEERGLGRSTARSVPEQKEDLNIRQHQRQSLRNSSRARQQRRNGNHRFGIYNDLPEVNEIH